MIKRKVFDLIETVKFTLILPIVGYQKFGKFIILTRPRTGSSLLRNLLNSHPNLFVRGEIFGLNRRIVSVDSVISKIWNYQPKHIQWAGFKLFYNHLFHERHKGLYQKILKNKAVRIIHLKRRNLVKAEISAALARQTGIWHGKFENNQREGIKIYMHPDTLAANLNMTLENYERIKSLLKNHEIIEVIYEDLVEELSQTMKEIYRFLNIKDHTFQTPFLKQSTESIESLVENHQELRNYFQGTRWYKYFE